MYKLYVICLWIVVFSVLVPAWPLELVVSFLREILIIGSVLLAFFFMRKPFKRKPGILLAFLPLAIGLILPLQAWVSNEQTVNAADSVTVLTHNMLYSADNATAVSEQARTRQADIVALQEVLPWQVEEVRRALGFRDVYISDCDCSVNEDELALVSRYPILEAKTINVDIRGGQIINVLLNVEGKLLRTFVVHLPVPILPSTYATRERGFSRLSSLVRQSEEPVLVMGDFNTTQWSPSLRSFEASNPQLNNVINSGSSAVSWCGTRLHIACLRIDHTYVDSRLEIVSSVVGKSVGSDHRAVITQIRL